MPASTFSRWILCRCILFVIASQGGSLFAQNTVDYVKEIKPLLRERCYACHGALKQEAGLRLDTAASMLQGGDSGRAVEVGAPASSLLLARVSSSDLAERMPPDGEPLKPHQIDAIRSWIQEGAKGYEGEEPDKDPRDHWAFRLPKRLPLPVAVAPEWTQNTIDTWISAKHKDLGLVPQPIMEKRLWLRRVTLDLVGLPPTLEELDHFMKDESPEAYDRVAVRLLNSPQYGERWGRHWMDIWRYSDWWGLGAEVRNSQKHIWHWRDWIVESLNEDKGYDQMLREMLAADELYPNDLDRLRATGFLARQYFKFNRTSWLDETIEHTSKAMLGLTFNCGKCHDHKYDPLSQQEYYRLRAIFEPYQIRTEMVPGEADFEKNGIPRAFDCNLDVPTFLHIRGDDRNPQKDLPLEAAVPSFLTSSELSFQVRPVTLPVEAAQPGRRSYVVENHRNNVLQKRAIALEEIKQAQSKLEQWRLRQSKKSSELEDKDRKNPSDFVVSSKEGERSNINSQGETPLVLDDFSSVRPEIWEVRAGEWTRENGKLVQSQIGNERAALRCRIRPPREFEAILRYVPLAGNRWKSVGIAFDVDELGNELFAYLSSVEGASKSQFSYKREGNSHYPAEGAEQRSVALNQEHQLRVRVRGRLINVHVDGKLSFAYRLPKMIERQDGFLEVVTYDAKAAFQSFEVRRLSSEEPMIEPNSAANQSENPLNEGERAEWERKIAEYSLRTTEAQLASIDAKAKGDANRGQDSEDETKRLIREASLAEKRWAFVRAQEELVRAEYAVLTANKNKRGDAEKKAQGAKENVDKAAKDLEQPSDTYQPLLGALKTLENNLETEASRSKPFPTTSSGRRSAFAEWLTSPQNPLPARVAVNHVWARHMGQPLVPTLFDFGRKGTPPSHPELLDWLAIEFQQHQWSMKHLHRVIVTSRLYRTTSSSADASETNLKLDPENRFYWRMNSNRMEAQVIRDSLLALANELDLKLGGPTIPATEEKSRRRSLYFFQSHNEHEKFLSTFDDANVLDCYRRPQSIVPQQALALENSNLVAELTPKIANRISSAVKSTNKEAFDHEFVRLAMLTILATEPSEEEVNVLRQALQQFENLANSSQRENGRRHAQACLVQALINLHDFISIR